MTLGSLPSMLAHTHAWLQPIHREPADGNDLLSSRTMDALVFDLHARRRVDGRVLHSERRNVEI